MNISTVNELIQSLDSAGELSIKETKVMALAKAYQQLAAENVGLKAGIQAAFEDMESHHDKDALYSYDADGEPMDSEPVAFIDKQWTLVYYIPPMSMGLKIGDKLYRHAQPAPVVPDEMLCDFYEVSNWPDLVRELVKHVEQLQDSAKRNVKPWEDTFPETLLPAYIERIKLADEACRTVPQSAPALPDFDDVLESLDYEVRCNARESEHVMQACRAMYDTCRAAMLQAGNSPVIGIDLASGPDRSVEVRYVAPPGYVMVPKVPDQAHLNSIAMRYRHDFYLLNDVQKDSALATARQMYEECSGQGFYTLPAAPQEVK